MDDLSPEQIKSMIKLLQNMLPEIERSSTTDPDVSAPKKQINKKSGSGRTKNKGKADQNQTNYFDNMPEFRMHKEDCEVDKRLIVQPPVPRARPFKLVGVVCRVCGKKEKVSPSLIMESVDRYKCNRCSTSSG